MLEGKQPDVADAAVPTQPIAQLAEIPPRSPFDAFHPSACYLLSQTYWDHPALVIGTGSIAGHIVVFTADHAGLAKKFVSIGQPGTSHEQVLANLGYTLTR